MRCLAWFSVAKVVKTFGPEPGIVESLDDFRYKILNGVLSGGSKRRRSTRVAYSRKSYRFCRTLMMTEK
jgi:hypothetical protein